MTTRELTQVALMGTILYVVFHAFSNILYLEMITFTILSFSQVFSRRDTVLSCILFSVIHLLLNGIMIWNIAYLVIFPFYGLVFSCARGFFKDRLLLISITAGVFSCLIGQLVDLPFLLFSQMATLFYVLMGIKTSLIQGCLTFIATLFLFEPIQRVLLMVKNRN